MTIYTEKFAPTYLYIKQHSVTKKLYFGKTTKDPEKYPGSGTHWCRHIKKHGKEHIETLWWCLFFDKETISEFALTCSEQWNIVESKEWLNKIPENGLDGRCPGVKHSDKSKLKMSIAKTGAHAKGIARKPHTGKRAKGVPREPHTGKKAKGTPATGLAAKGMPGRGAAAKGMPATGKKAKGTPATGNNAKGVPKPKHECHHCGTLVDAGNLKRYHGDKCKHKNKL